MVRNRPRARELTPWCGIMKIGGLGVQDMGGEDGEEDVCPALSQGSTISNLSAAGSEYAAGNKRRFEDEEEEEERLVYGASMDFGS